MSKYQRTVPRIMTPEEARTKCVEMGLDQRVTDHVVGEFQMMHDRAQSEHRTYCSCRNPVTECEQTTGEDGRLAWGQSWEGALEELAQAMGRDLDAEDLDLDADEELQRVWDAFFQE